MSGRVAIALLAAVVLAAGASASVLNDSTPTLPARQYQIQYETGQPNVYSSIDIAVANVPGIGRCVFLSSGGVWCK